MDNLLFQSASIEELEEKLDKFFTECEKNNVQISKKKFKASSRVEFGGSVIDTTEDDVRVYTDPEKVEKVKNFPTPKTR